jgi:hypothetical protein
MDPAWYERSRPAGTRSDPGRPGLLALIDFEQPAGLLMTAVLHFVADDWDP